MSASATTVCSARWPTDAYTGGNWGIKIAIAGYEGWCICICVYSIHVFNDIYIYI